MNEYTIGVIVFVIYVIAGVSAVKYVKTNIFGVVAEFTDSLLNLFIKNVLYGSLFGWLAIPVALIHWIFIGRNR